MWKNLKIRFSNRAESIKSSSQFRVSNDFFFQRNLINWLIDSATYNLENNWQDWRKYAKSWKIQMKIF